MTLCEQRTGIYICNGHVIVSTEEGNGIDVIVWSQGLVIKAKSLPNCPFYCNVSLHML